MAEKAPADISRAVLLRGRNELELATVKLVRDRDGMGSPIVSVLDDEHDRFSRWFQ